MFLGTLKSRARGSPKRSRTSREMRLVCRLRLANQDLDGIVGTHEDGSEDRGTVSVLAGGDTIVVVVARDLDVLALADGSLAVRVFFDEDFDEHGVFLAIAHA